MTLLIKNGLLYLGNNEFIKRDLICSNGFVTEIGKNLPGESFVDATGLIVSPGFVDLHVHLREPGQPHKETIATGTAAALAGGFTTICAMPNLNPAPDNEEHLALQQAIIKRDANCKVIPFMTITKNRAGKEVIDVFPQKDCAGISDDGNGIQDPLVMEQALQKAAGNNILVAAHCEDKTYGASNAAEYHQLERDLKLVSKHQCRYHVCHVSTKESMELIKAAKKNALPVSCEVTPHHLLLCEDDITDDHGRFKMAPALHTAADKAALINATQSGFIDAIATDHAPHCNKEKNCTFAESVFGVVGLETAFSILYTNLVETGILPLEKLLFLLTFGPSKIIKLPCGIAVGNRADITLLDLNAQWEINSNNFLSKGHSTPFEGKKVKGKIVKTILNGHIKFTR
ncbi:MAG: dihydroorotase [Oscillospiraceae bacterium]|jgi:dihydroorotase|nr:dihydroorotase [Oscillospiraceae bacterium]